MNNKYIDNKLREFREKYFKWSYPTSSFEDSQRLIEQFIKEALLQQQDEIATQLLKDGHGGGNWRRLIIQLKSEQETCNCLCHFKTKPTPEEYAVSSYYGCTHCQKPEEKKDIDKLAQVRHDG